MPTTQHGCQMLRFILHRRHDVTFRIFKTEDFANRRNRPIKANLRATGNQRRTCGRDVGDRNGTGESAAGRIAITQGCVAFFQSAFNAGVCRFPGVDAEKIWRTPGLKPPTKYGAVELLRALKIIGVYRKVNDIVRHDTALTEWVNSPHHKLGIDSARDGNSPSSSEITTRWHCESILFQHRVDRGLSTGRDPMT